MKKLLVVFVLLISFSAIAQKTNLYTPFLDGGVSISNNNLSYLSGLGIANTNSRYVVELISTTKRPNNVWSISTKGLWKISDRKVAEQVSVYATGAVRMALTTLHPLTIEPGLAAILNLKNRLSPQVSIGFPIQQNAVFRNRPLGFSAGLSLNYRL